MALTTDERERLIDELEGVLVPATRALYDFLASSPEWNWMLR